MSGEQRIWENATVDDEGNIVMTGTLTVKKADGSVVFTVDNGVVSGEEGVDAPSALRTTTDVDYHYSEHITNRVDAGVTDHVAITGFGLLSTGGPELVDGGGNATLPGVGWGLESRYNTGSGYNVSEWYPIFIPIGSTAQTRPFYLTFRHDTLAGSWLWTNTTQALFPNNIPFLRQQNAAANNTIEIVRVNASDEVEFCHDAGPARFMGTVTCNDTVTVATSGSSTKRLEVTSASLAITPTSGVVTRSDTAATALVTVQSPPAIMQRGTAWNTSANRYVGMRMNASPQSAATPYGAWSFEDAVSATQDDSGWTWTQRALVLGGSYPELRFNGARAIGVDGTPNLYVGGSGITGGVYVWGSTIYLYPGANMLAANSTGLGFFGATPVAKPTGVAVDAAGIHAALVSLGLIAA